MWVNGLHYRIDGPSQAPAGAPVLVLSNSLGTDLSMWQPQLESFARHYRVLRYDTRGHGESLVQGPTATIAELGQNVLAIMDHEKINQAHFCGISLGGLTGLWLASHAPERFKKFVLANTSPRIGNRESWQGRIDLINERGLAPVAQSAGERWFTEKFRAQHPDVVAQIQAKLAAVDPKGYLACCTALREADLWPDIGKINSPCLVISGQFDPVTTTAEAVRLSSRLRDARQVTLPASHLSNIETSAEFTRAVEEFL